MRSVVRILCLMILLGQGAMASRLKTSEIHELYGEGKRFFREGVEACDSDPDRARELFAKAALRFERIANEGKIHNGKLYYNIGNCYFRMGNLGKAILFYRRAEQYSPNDPNLRQNLAYARSKRLDRIDVPERKRVLETLFFFHYDVSRRTRAIIFSIAFMLFWLLLILRLYVRSGWIGWPAGLSAAVALLMAGSLAVEQHRFRTVRPGVIIQAETVARKGDGASYEPAFTEPLHAGTEFEWLETRGDWLHVVLGDGRTCWLPAKDVELVR